MDETEELIRLSVRALAAQMSAAPGFELHMTATCAFGLTDEPLADFNMLMLGPDPDAEGFLRRAIGRARERERPLLAVMSPHVVEALAAEAAALGLTPAGVAPLMVMRPTTLVDSGAPIRVTRALGADLVSLAGDLAAAAFEVPRDAVARCIDAGITPSAGVETWIGFADGAAVSAVTVTPAGDTAGISMMATAPERQRQGHGRALLTAVMADYRRRGVNRFYLGATAAGLPLYESLGFETVAPLTAWLLRV